MSLSATLFGRDSFIHRATNVLGLGIPGWLDRKFGVPDAQGPALGELAQQTSQEGSPRAIVWGIVRPIAGNIIAVQDPPKIRKVKQKQEGGKGGGSKKKDTYVDNVFRTYAIRICEGPITGIRRVWRNNKLVYDNRPGSSWGAKNNKTFLAQAKFYLGGWQQMPAPELQAIFGMGNVTAHRGTCYMTMTDENLTELGGAVPQYIFEVERAEGLYLTSRPYPAEDTEAAQGFPSRIREIPVVTTVDTISSQTLTVGGGIFRNLQVSYVPEPEQLIGVPGTPSAIFVSAGPVQIGVTEVIENSALGVLSGRFYTSQIAYSNWAPETLRHTTLGIISGYFAAG